MLHNDKELFEQLVFKTSEVLGIEASIIEKDYFVTLFLKQIVEKNPNIIFKGGTSLSKCYKIINRFSEDIDLTLKVEEGDKPSESQRKNLKKSIVETIENLDFTLTNPEKQLSRRDYNKYIIDYPSIFEADFLKQHLIVETAVHIKSYPCEKMTASSFIYDFLIEGGYDELITKYKLEPFPLNVQTAQRTFVDKIFALGDYYLNGQIQEHSRHIYDLYQLSKIVDVDDNLKQLIKDVKESRQKYKHALSSQENVDVAMLLQEIIDKDIYKEDYNSITLSLLFEKVEYSIAIEVLKQIANEIRKEKIDTAAEKLIDENTEALSKLGE